MVTHDKPRRERVRGIAKTGHAEIVAVAPPEAIWRVVADVTRTGEYLEIDSIVPRTALLAGLILAAGRDPVIRGWAEARRGR